MSSTLFETFCEENPGLRDDVTTLRQAVVDMGLAVFAIPQVVALNIKDAETLLASLTAVGLVRDDVGFRHLDGNCEHWSRGEPEAGDRCEACGEPLVETAKETHYSWVGTLPAPTKHNKMANEGHPLAQNIVMGNQIVNHYPPNPNHQEPNGHGPASWEKIFAVSCGAVLVVTMLVLAIMIPEPKPFQYLIFRIIIAVAIAGVASTIPGFIRLDINKWLHAGGAMAVFAIVYFYNPASLVSKPEMTDPQGPTGSNSKELRQKGGRVIGEAAGRLIPEHLGAFSRSTRDHGTGC